MFEYFENLWKNLSTVIQSCSQTTEAIVFTFLSRNYLSENSLTILMILYMLSKGLPMYGTIFILSAYFLDHENPSFSSSFRNKIIPRAQFRGHSFSSTIDTGLTFVQDIHNTWNFWKDLSAMKAIVLLSHTQNSSMNFECNSCHC